jgi:ABC-type multidrug transport system fused ATPase/permease subunit
MTLPVASSADVRAYARRLLRRHPRQVAAVLGFYVAATAVALVTPRLLGELVDAIRHGTTRGAVDRTALLIGGCVLAQAVLVRFARLCSARFGEQVLAELREEFVDRVLALPLSTVEQAGTGDLVTRSSRDVTETADVVQRGAPEIAIGIVQVLLSLGAIALVGPIMLLPVLAAVPLIWWSTAWYLHRATPAYLREGAAFSRVTDGLSETVDGARTVDTLGLADRRIEQTFADLRELHAAQLGALRLRTWWFPAVEFGYVVPIVSVLLMGGWFAADGWVTAGQVTAACLYTSQLLDPLDAILSWIDHVQVGATSFARILGVSRVPADRVAEPRTPDGENLDAAGLRYSYVDGRDVLHGVDLSIRPGERLAVVGPSGAGKSTLGRLLAGIHPPRTGRVTVGGVPLVSLPLDELRGHVALVTQEHHIFVGTLRDNVALAVAGSDEAVHAALAAVDALDWALALPSGLDTEVGSGGVALSPAQAQQIALARLVLADPHTLVLDEATSLLDPRAARHLERSLAGALRGRTVIAIAHRLFSAHDADRVAVVEDGLITELGSHDDLVAAGGAYAALWASWHGTHTPV